METVNNKTSVNFEKVYPIFSIEENKVIGKDGRVAVGFKLHCAEMEKWTPAGYENLISVFTGSLSSLPVGTLLQKTDIYYDHPYQQEVADKPYFQAKTAGYFLDRLMLFHESYLFVSFSPVKLIKTNALNSLFASVGKTLLADPLEGIAKRLEQAETSAHELATNLETIPDIHVERLDNEALENLYLQYFNLEFARQPTQFIREMSNHLSCITIGEKKVNIVTLKGQGSAVYPSVKNGYGVTTPMIYPLTHELPFPHIVTQSILIEDTAKGLNSLDNERKLNNSLHFLSTQDNQLKSEEIEAFTADVRANNKRLVSLHLSVIIFEINDKARKSNIERTLSAFRAMSGCEAIIESLDTAGLYFASAPGNSCQVPERWLLMPADYAACYLNFNTTYQPDRSGDLLCDRFRNPLLVNLFNTSLNNQNCLTIGPSGSGKSYTMGNFITQRFERSTRQIIIDVGGTYKNLMESLVGMDCYFEYELEHPLSFNPFLLEKKDDNYMLTGDKINFLTALLSTIWKGTETAIPLSPAERAIFVRIIPAYYAHLNAHGEEKPSMQGFYHWFKKQDLENRSLEEYRSEMQFFNVAQFLVVLRPFVEGEYRAVLNADREIDISEFPLVCFDMAKVKSDPSLYPVISMLITELALDQVRKFPTDQKYIYMDEAWSMLSDSMGDWVESMYRTIRKNNGSMCIITQGIDEIIESAVGTAIIANAQTQIILNHTDKNQVAKVATHLGFTDHEVDKINSIRKGRGYRELFIKQGDVGKVYCLEVCPHLDAVLSSKPVERNYLRELTRRYKGNIHFAVDQYVEDKAMSKNVFAQGIAKKGGLHE